MYTAHHVPKIFVDMGLLIFNDKGLFPKVARARDGNVVMEERP